MPNDLALGSGSKNPTNALHLVAESQPGSAGGLRGRGGALERRSWQLAGQRQSFCCSLPPHPQPPAPCLGSSSVYLPWNASVFFLMAPGCQGSPTPFPASHAPSLKGPQSTILPKQADAANHSSQASRRDLWWRFLQSGSSLPKSRSETKQNTPFTLLKPGKGAPLTF